MRSWPSASCRWVSRSGSATPPGHIFPWAEEALGDAELPEVLSDVDGIQVEKVAALAPDLIVGLYSGMTQAEYDLLSQIAPVVATTGR